MGDEVTLKDLSIKLTEDILQDCLKEAYGSDVKLQSYKINSLSAKGGNNYISATYRIVAHCISCLEEKEVTIQLFAKNLPPNLAWRKTFRSAEFFSNEVTFYTQALTAFTALQKEQKPKKPFNAIPRCFFAFSDGENDVLLLEDLSVKNYVALERTTNLDFDMCKSILELLGRFHALSFALKDKNPDDFRRIASTLKETYFKPETKEWYKETFERMTYVAFDAVRKELPEPIYEEKLRNFTDSSYYDRMIEFVKPKEPYAVINHGDAWAPNFLVPLSPNEINGEESLYTIDFQLARYSSPILDVATFVYICASKEVIFERFDDLMNVYYNSVRDFVEDLGSSAESVYPYGRFQEDVLSYFAFGAGCSLEAVPLSIVEGSETPDIEAIEGDEAVPLSQVWALEPIKSKEGRGRLAANIKHSVDRGFI